MNFLDGSLFTENQEKLVITAAPYGPEWVPSDFPEDIPVTMEAQVQKAVDCYNAGASQLLQYLISQAFVPEFQVRWRWQPNSMAMWDNRSTQHYAVMDYPPCHRKMERAGIIGEATF